MSALFDLTLEYLNKKKEFKNLNNRYNNNDYINKLSKEKVNELTALSIKINNFLSQSENILQKICMIYGSLHISYKQGNLFFNGSLPSKSIQFNEENCFEVANLCFENISKCVKLAINDSFGLNEVKTLCICHYSLKCILKHIDGLKGNIIDKITNEENNKKESLSEIAIELEKLRERIHSLAKSYKNDISKGDYKNKIFLGYKNTDCNDEVKRFLKAEYKFTDEDFFKQPILLGLGNGEKNVAFFENINSSYEEFIRYVYLNNGTNFNSIINVCTINSELGYPHSTKLLQYINATFKDKNDKDISIKNLILNLPQSDNLFEKLIAYKDNRIKDFEKYNDENPLSLKDYILVVIDNFPDCIDTDEKRMSFVRLVNDSARSGFFFIINGKYKEQFYGKNYLENENSSNASLSFSLKNNNIELLNYTDPNYSFVYSDKENDLLSLKNKIYKHNRKLHTILLEEKKEYLADLLDENKDYVGYDIGKGINIPIGFTDEGQLYNFSTNVKDPGAAFAILTGNTGCGKTSLIHTLILMGALKYSPEELEFYVIDFKSSLGSADFDQYTYRPGVENAYIPHIKYLSTKASKDSAFDVLNLINKFANENLVQFKACNAQNLNDYNERAKNRSDLKPIPQRYFIIDEYAVMMDAGNAADANNFNDVATISKSLLDILSRVRTTGVGIIFSGQKYDTLEANARSRVSNHLVYDLGFNDPEKIREALNISYTDETVEQINNYYKYISNKQGYFISRKNISRSCVHSIYCGDVGSPQINNLAKLIRKRCKDKYPYKQSLPGSSSFESADSFLNEEVSNKANRNIIKFNDDNSVNVYNEYDQGLKLALYLGVSNTISTPMPLKFNNNNPNFIAYANNKKLAKISSNAIASLLYETSDQDTNNISYLSVHLDNDQLAEEIALNEIKSYATKNAFFEKRLNIIEDPEDAIKKIITLYDLWHERKMSGLKRNKKEINVDLKTPEYLIINNIDWMFDDDIVSSLEINFDAVDSKEEVIIENTNDEEMISEDDLNDLIGNFFGDNMNATEVLQNVDTKQSVRSSKTFSSTDIINRIVTLLNDGVKQNIYCIVCLNKESSFTTLSTMMNGLNNYKSMIYGSFNYIGKPVVNEFGEVLNTCALSNGGEASVIRLYDYTTDKAQKFWDELESKYLFNYILKGGENV